MACLIGVNKKVKVCAPSLNFNPIVKITNPHPILMVVYAKINHGERDLQKTWRSVMTDLLLYPVHLLSLASWEMKFTRRSQGREPFQTCEILQHMPCVLPEPLFSNFSITHIMLRRDGIQPSHEPDCTLSQWQETTDRQVTQSIATTPFLIWVLPSLEEACDRRSDPAWT